MMAEHYKEQKIFSFVHFSSGQEIAPVAISLGLNPGDRVFGNHRSHAHYLASGGDMLAMFLEMLGSTDGASGGFGGSMHLIDEDRGFWGSSPVLGSIAPIAAGSAFEQSANPNSSNITVVYIGDGASEEGVVAETLNLVALWNLPLLLVIEDNLYAVNSPGSVRRPEGFGFKKLVEAYGLPFYHAPRLSVEDHISSCTTAVRSVQNSRAPGVLLAESFRNFAHSSPLTDDHLNYREVDGESTRMHNDHLVQLRHVLVSAGLSAYELARVEQQAEDDIRLLIAEASRGERRFSRDGGEDD